MITETKKTLNDLHFYQKRVELLVGAKFKDTNAVLSAVLVQDKLRKKIGKWSGSEEVRKWRQRV